MRSFITILILAAVLVTASPASARMIGDVGYHANVSKHHQEHVRSEPVSAGLVSSAPASVSSAAVGGGTSWLSGDEVADYVRQAGFPESVIPTMVAIAYRESHWNAHAVNLSSGACGLFQLFPCPGITALDPMVNAQLAYLKYQASGLAPWGM